MSRSTLKRLLDWSVFLLVVSAAWFFAGPTSLGGPANYIIVDGQSMEPTYHDGDLVVARERSEYEVGDVIVYDAPVDAQFNVIHRVIAPTTGGFITQGDNRDEPDGWIAPTETVYGASWFVIPQGGRWVRLLREPPVIAGIAAGFTTLELLKRSERTKLASSIERAEATS